MLLFHLNPAVSTAGLFLATTYKMGEVKKEGVLTSYKINNATYASYILGGSMSEVLALAAKRNLSEVVESNLMKIDTMPDYSILPDDEFLNRLPEILHSATFLSFVALKSNTIKVEDVLGDEGVLHEIAHYISNVDGCYKKSLTCIRDLISSLQQNAIGLY